MEFLVGTSAGVFQGGSGAPVKDGPSRGIRHLSLIGSDLFSGGSDGVFRSGDGGRSWKASGLDACEVWDMASPGTGRTIYAGTQPAGLYASQDGGSSWKAVDSFLKAPGADRWCLPGVPPPSARARTLAFAAGDPARFRVGIEVGGVAASDDGGASWDVTLPGGNPDIHIMVGHPARPGVIFATTGFGRIDNSEPREKRIAGTFRSDDGGKTWTYLWEGIQPPYTRPICIDPRPPHAITVACAPTAFSSITDEGGAKAMLYRSDDDGGTWRSLGDEAHAPSAANFLAVTPDADRAGGVLVGTETGEVWRVSPEGSWTKLAEGLPAVQALLALA